MNKDTLLFNKIESFYKKAQDIQEQRLAKANEFLNEAKREIDNLDLKNIIDEAKKNPKNEKWHFEAEFGITKSPANVFRNLDNYQYDFMLEVIGTLNEIKSITKVEGFSLAINKAVRDLNNHLKSFDPNKGRNKNVYETLVSIKNNLFHIPSIVKGDSDWALTTQVGPQRSEPVSPPGDGPSQVSNQDDSGTPTTDPTSDAAPAPDATPAPDAAKKSPRKGYDKISANDQNLLNWYLVKEMKEDPDNRLIIDEILGPKTFSAINKIKRHLNFKKSNSELFTYLQSLKDNSKSGMTISPKQLQEWQEFENFQKTFSNALSYLKTIKDRLQELYEEYDEIFSTSSVYKSQLSILELTPFSKQDFTKHLEAVDSIFSDFNKIFTDKVRARQVNSTQSNKISPLLGDIRRTRIGLRQELTVLMRKDILPTDSPRATASALYLNNEFISLSHEMDYFKKSLAQENMTPIDTVSKAPQSGKTDTSGQASWLQPEEVANRPIVSKEIKTRIDNLIQDASVRKFFGLNFNSLKNSKGEFDDTLDKKTYQAMNAMKRFYRISSDDQLFNKIFEIDKINIPRIAVKSQQLVKDYLSKYNITSTDFELDGLVTKPFRTALKAAKDHYMAKLQLKSLTDKDFINKLIQESNISQMHSQTQKELYPGGAPKITSEIINKKIISLANDLKNIRI